VALRSAEKWLVAEIAEMDKPNATSEYTNSKTWKENPPADQS
jgi:hypothetical protein